MGTMEVKIEPMTGAIEKLNTLGSNVNSARIRANNAIPSRASVSTLTSTGAAGTFDQWVNDQITEPLQPVLDIAILLDTEASGEVTYTFSGAYSEEKMTENLGEILTTQLQDTDLTDEQLQRVIDVAGNYSDNDTVQTAIMEGLGPAGIAGLIRRAGDASIPMENVTNVFSDDSQEQIANWVSEDIADPENIDLTTTALMAGFANSEPFTTELYETVTPAQMGDAVVYLNDHTYNGMYVDGGEPGINEDMHEIYQEFMRGAGTSFANYTTNVSNPEELADTWFNAITDEDNPNHASALTMLIRKGGENAAFDDDFLFKLTDDIYEWERDQDGPVWLPRDGSLAPMYDPDIVDPSLDSDELWDAYERGIRSDGLANLFGSMEHTPEAAQRFMAEGYENGEPGGPNERMEYLLMERTFSYDRQSDEGYGLGVMFEAAAAGDLSDDFSAGFATDLYEYVAEQVENNVGDSGWQPNVLGDDKWHGYPGVSVALGNIGAAYSEDIYELLDNDSYPQGERLQIDAETLEHVVGLVGYHDDMSGLETLSAGLMSEGNDRMRTLLEGRPPPHDLESLQGLDMQGILDSNGEVLGKVLDQGLASKAEGEELQQQRAEFAAKAFDIATNFVPGAGDIAKGVKDTLWETAIDTGKDEGLDALKGLIENSPDATSGQYAELQNSQFEDLIRYNTYDQLLSTGYLDDYIGDGQIPDSMIVGEGEDRRFRQDIRFDGVDGLPEDLSASERQEISDGMAYLLTNHPDVDGPGGYLQGLLTDALNGYDRVKPDPE